jgi:hypothetical protein
MKNYKIADVAVEIRDDKVVYWIYNAGFHPGQGGMEFVYGNSGYSELEPALDVLKRNLLRDIDYLLEEVRKRNED